MQGWWPVLGLVIGRCASSQKTAWQRVWLFPGRKLPENCKMEHTPQPGLLEDRALISGRFYMAIMVGIADRSFYKASFKFSNTCYLFPSGDRPLHGRGKVVACLVGSCSIIQGIWRHSPSFVGHWGLWTQSVPGWKSRKVHNKLLFGCGGRT